MSEPFVGQLKMFAGTFAPRGWAFADGQLLAVSQNDALFSLYGTTYGGDGRTTFGLPDLRGRVPVHLGQGPGLAEYRQGSKGGAEEVTLNVNQLPSHTHAWPATDATGTERAPAGHVPAAVSGSGRAYGTGGTTVDLPAAAVGDTGGSRAHTNIQPYLCINFIVALVGVYPSRN